MLPNPPQNSYFLVKGKYQYQFDKLSRKYNSYFVNPSMISTPQGILLWTVTNIYNRVYQRDIDLQNLSWILNEMPVPIDVPDKFFTVFGKITDAEALEESINIAIEYAIGKEISRLVK